jgi:hypothetical protein
MKMDEQEFRALVRRMVKAQQYPDHAKLISALGRSFYQLRSGLSVEQDRWCREEIEAAGYDWERSKRARGLIRRT